MQQEFAILQTTVYGIVSDVFAKVKKLRLGSYQVIETVLLPAAATIARMGIDFSCGKTLPFFTLLQHRIIVSEGCQQMDMIRHDHKVRQQIFDAIEMLQALSHDSCIRWLTQHAFTMTQIKFPMPAS